MTEQQGKKKPNEKKQEEKRNQKNWGGGRPRAKLESRPTGSRCCLLLSKVCRVENVEKRRKREEGKKVADVTTLMGKELNDTRHGVCIQRKPSGTDAGSMETERDKTAKTSRPHLRTFTHSTNLDGNNRLLANYKVFSLP